MAQPKKGNGQTPFVWKDPNRLGSPEKIPGKCGAKLKGRKGGYCKRPPMLGEKHCHQHKGRGVVPNQKDLVKNGRKSTKHHHPIKGRNIYEDGLLPDEKPIFDIIEIGKVDMELRIARLQLRRLLIAQKAYQKALSEEQYNPDGSVSVTLAFEAPPTVDEDGNLVPGKVLTKKAKRNNDYTSDINKTLENISKIEVRRAALMQSEPPDMANTPLTKLIDMLSKIRPGDSK